MVKGISAYNSIKGMLPKASKSKQAQKTVATVAAKAEKIVPKFLVLPGVAGVYSIVSTNHIKCEKSCNDFDCDFNVYTWP